VLSIAHLGVQLLLINHGVIGFECGARFWNGIRRFIFVFEIVVVGQIENIQS
jgi:hypothetical protein